MASGKWIDGLEPQMPLVEAARRVLTVRLEAVANYLPPAMCWPTDDPEPIHHLRVGTRRARAALDAFSICLPRKRQRKGNKILRRIRRAAGEARDWDVFRLALAQLKPGGNANKQRGIDFIAGFAASQRADKQASFLVVCDSAVHRLDGVSKKLVGRVRKSALHSMSSLLDLARTRLSSLLSDLQKSAAKDLSESRRLHRVRIAGKRLRYAMEIFGTCFTAEFREIHYSSIEQMQEILGTVNDSHVAIAWLKTISEEMRRSQPASWPGYRAGFESIRRFHEGRLRREQQNFEAWWKNWQGSGGEEQLRALIQHQS